MNQNGISTSLLQLIDGVIVYLSFFIAVFLRNVIRSVIGMTPVEGQAFEGSSVFITVAIILIPVLLETSRFYSNTNRGGYIRPFKSALTAVAISSLFLAILIIVLQIQPSSRFLFLGIPPIILIMLMLRAWCVRTYLRSRSAQSARNYSVQIFGSQSEVEEFLESVPDEKKLFWDVKKSIDLEDIAIRDLVEILKKRSVAKAIFISSQTQFDRVSRAIELCESMGVESMVRSNFLRTKLSIPEVDNLGGNAMITLRSTPSVSYSLVAKKLLDRIGAACIILATLPLWIFAAIGIRLRSPQGPVFFKQQRAGLYGRPFTMWKFRTMHPDAEAQLDQVKKEVGNEMDGPVFKLDQDPRVFAFGSILRRTSIDELPQLINVLTGEMSLVGPRPLPLYEVEEFQKSEYRRRLSIKPGITCYWQAGGRNSITDFEDWVALDLKYIDNWSFLLDVKILLMTVPAVLFSKGAK